MRITALAGGTGAAGLLLELRDRLYCTGQSESELTVIANTGSDITLHGLRICPDVDALARDLGSPDDERDIRRNGQESYSAAEEFSAFGAEHEWFFLSDRELALQVLRSHRLSRGETLSTVTSDIARRFGLPERGIRLLPMSDDPVETHVVVDLGEGPTAVHYLEWCRRHPATSPPQRLVAVGMDRARPAPGTSAALEQADLILLCPSDPVTSIGTILLVPGLREQIRRSKAPVIGICPALNGGGAHAQAVLAHVCGSTRAAQVADLYADLLDGWIIDRAESSLPDSSDGPALARPA